MAVDAFTVSFVSPADHDKFQVYLFFDDASIEAEDTSFRVATDLGGECGAVVATTTLGSGQIQRVVQFQFPLWQIGANRVWVQAISGPGSLTTYAEPSLHEVRFGEPAPNWGLQLLYPATSFNTPHFQLPFSPHITSCTHQLCKDADLDGLLDAWENVATYSNRPVLLIDPDDGLWASGKDEIFSFSRVTPMRRVSVPSQRAIFIGTVFGWSRDYGNPTFGGAHTGDAEAHVSVWEDVGNGGFEYVGQMTAGHNAAFAHVEHYWEWVGGIGYLRVTPEGVIRIWAEEDKHGTWPSDFECGGAGGYDCGATYQDDFRPESYNIGEGDAADSFAPGRILLDDLNHVHEFGPHELLFDMFPNEAVWRLPQHGESRFCGGLPCDGSPPQISSKISSIMNWTAVNSSQHYETDLAAPPSTVTCGTP